MIALIIVAIMVAILAPFGIWFVGRLGEIDRQTYAKLEAERKVKEARVRD